MPFRYLLIVIMGLLCRTTTVWAACQAPNYLNTGTPGSRSVYLSWSNPNGGAPSYQVQYRFAGQTGWTRYDVGTSTSASLTNLAPKTSYEWRVRAVCAANDTSAYTAALSFTTVCVTPAYIYAGTPTHESVYVNWSYYGNESPTYQVQYRPVGTASWISRPALSATATTLTGLTNDTNYEWRVRSICSAGDSSAVSSTGTFRTVCVTPGYTGTADITYQSARLTWGNAVYGSVYEVNWRPVGSATWTTVGGVAATELTLNGLANSTTYEWKVRTICSASATSAFTTPITFQTQCLTPQSLNTPLTSVNAAEIRWTNAPGVHTADLRWRAAGTANWTDVPGINSSDYALTGLLPNTTYEWQVRSACGAIDKSAYTASVLFITNCDVPTGLTTLVIEATTLTFAWTAKAPVTLQYRAAGAANWLTVSPTADTYTLTGLVNNTVYEWRVRTECGPGVSSDYTPTQLVTTRCSAPTSPNSSMNAQNELVCSWAGVNGYVYELQWRVAGTSDWIVASGITRANYTIRPTGLNTTYEWRVRRACSATDFSDFTPTSIYTPTCQRDYISTYYYRRTSSSVELSWSTSSGPTAAYELQWQPAGAASWTVVSGLNTTSYILSGLTPGVTYQWRVRRMCTPTIGSDFVNGSSFSTQCTTPPTYFNQIGIGATTASLGWSGYESYAPHEINYRAIGQANWQIISNITSGTVALSGLTPNTTYEWRVQSICPAGMTATFGATQTFSTQCGGGQSNFSVQSVRTTEATVSWYGWTGPLSYDVQYREVGSGTWLTKNGPASEINQATYTGAGLKRYTVYGLAVGKTYEWQVRAVCEAGVSSAFAGGPAFTTQCPVPVWNGSPWQPDNSRLTIYWNTFSPDETFDVQWRPQGTTAWLSENGFTGSAYTLTNLTVGATYEYRVQRTCSATLSSGFSVINTRTVSCLAPQNIVATAGLGTSVKLSWEYTAATADEFSRTDYSIQYRVSGSSTWVTVFVPATSATGQYPSLAYSVTGLTPNTTYEFQVRAECSPQQVSAYTYPTGHYINCPTVNSPNTAAGLTAANLSWYTYTNRSAFQVQWRQVGTSTWTSVAITDGVYGTNVYSLTGLTPGTTYEWRVATNCGNGFLADYTSPQSFLTSCNATAANSLYGTVGVTSIALNWSYNASFLGTSTVQYRPVGTVAWTSTPPQTSQSLSLTGLTTYTTYQVRVRSSCGDGGAFGLSSIVTFQPICRPVLYSSSDSPQLRAVRISWSTDNNAPVSIQWRPVGGTSWQEQAGVSSPYLLTGLTVGTDYEYRFLTTCTPANTISSSTYLFTTASPSVLRPYIQVDSTDTQTAYLSVLGTEGTDYAFRLRVVGTATWTTTGLLTATTYLIQGLLPTTAYEVQLVTGPVGQPIYSQLIQFSTGCPQPGSLVADRIGASAALLRWSFTRSIPTTVQWRAGGTVAWTTSPAVTNGVYSLTGLLATTTYEWRVGTVCSGATGYSPVSSFRTTQSCPAPSLIYGSAASLSSAQLSWENTNPALLSTIRYRVVGTSTWTLLSGLVGAVVNLTGLTANTTYDCAVAFDCGGGNTSAFSNSARFTTRCRPPYSSTTQSTPTQARLSWQQGGPDYVVRWRQSNATNWSTVPTSTTQLTLTNLTPNTSYEWQVRSACSANVDASYAYGSTFSTQCNSSGLYIRPVSALSATAVRLNFTSYSNSAADLYTYTVGWRVAGTSTWQTASGLTAPYTLTGLSPNTTYEWQVRSDCATQFGDPLTFQTSCALPANFRVDQQTNSTARLIWTDALGSADYDLQWRVAGSNVWNTVANLTGTAYTLTGLTENTVYEWQVRGQCGPGTPYKTTLAFRLISERQTSIMTTKPGNWNDPTVWTCTCIPTSTDVVLIRHLVTVPASYTGYSKRVFYESGGRVKLNTASQLKSVP